MGNGRSGILSRERRRFLQFGAALAGGLFVPVRASAAQIRDLKGAVFVNGAPAHPSTAIVAGDRVTAAFGSRIAFNLGDDAFLVRGGTSLVIEGAADNALISGLRLLTGGLLSVFGAGRRSIVTRTATIGIRGTGVYLDVKPEQTYFCTCYGETVIHDGGEAHAVSASHHNAHWINTDEHGAMTMLATEVIGHTDDELRTLEGYVGRVPRFDR